MADLRREELDQIITLVDGSWMSGVVDMLWAHFRHDIKNNAAKAHVWFELAKGVPVVGTITDANTSEFDQLQPQSKRPAASTVCRDHRLSADFNLDGPQAEQNGLEAGGILSDGLGGRRRIDEPIRSPQGTS